MLAIRRTMLSLWTFAAAAGAIGACSSDDESNAGGQLSPDGGIEAGASGGAVNGTGGASGGNAPSGGTAGTAGVPSGGAAGSGASSSGGTGGAPPRPTCASDADCVVGRCDTAQSRCIDCLFNNECDEGETCDQGRCTPPLECANARDCRDQSSTLTICDGRGVCVECAGDADCGDGRVCAVNVCVESDACVSDPDCDAGEVCDTAQSRCVECLLGAVATDGGAGDGGGSAVGACASGSACIVGKCRVECASDNDCLTGDQLCDTNAGACADCLVDGDCDSLEYCDNGACQPDVCAQGVAFCIGGAVVECNENGSGTLAPTTCGAGQSCDRVGGVAGCVDPTAPDGGVVPAECNDGEMNGNETDVDCGGSCGDCAVGDSCASGGDCGSGVCEPACSGLLCLPGTRSPVCRAASCNDSTQNGSETDEDCGGPDCSQCEVGLGCSENSDCESNICQGGTCEAAACDPSACRPCLFPTDQPCCLPSGSCGCAQTFPFPGSCN